MSSFTWVLGQYTWILRLPRQTHHLMSHLPIPSTILIPSETLLPQKQKAKWAAMWLLIIECGSSGKAANFLNLWATSPGPHPPRKQNEPTKISCKYLCIYNSVYLWLELGTGTLFIVCLHDSNNVTCFFISW